MPILYRFQTDPFPVAGLSTESFLGLVKQRNIQFLYESYWKRFLWLYYRQNEKDNESVQWYLFVYHIAVLC